ncbi:MAG: hypothetical protein K0B02_00400 [DPANN group archaeon]|nr:hypothetical protein [DPANN group archaeon]
MTTKKEFIKKRSTFDKNHMILFTIIILLGLLVLTHQNYINTPKIKSDISACKTFCTTHPQITGAIYGGIDNNGHCLCKISQTINNIQENKNMDVTIFVDVGIVEKAILTDSP